ncbi:MAG: HAD family hydrolase [Peptococcaceae bacterium]|nr:MAG: HAD family hydrolase [Peptococcaceae bacterium]
MVHAKRIRLKMIAVTPQKPYIVHNLPGRARIAVPLLKGNTGLLTELSDQLARLPGVRKVKGSVVSGRALVHFAPSILDCRQLLEAITACQRDFLFKIAHCDVINEEYADNYPVGKNMEPEDLPLKRQIFNVALGGAVLAALSVKRYTRGASTLAGSSALFNLATATAIATGYPVIRSGLKNLSGRKQINFDLLISALSLGTLVLRESIPGLFLIWLVNFNSLLQSLLLAGAHRLIKKQATASSRRQALAGNSTGEESLPACSNETQADLPEPAMLYGSRMVPVAAGFSFLSGLLTRDFSRSLAMLLAAAPGPAGLARPAVLSSGLAAARRAGALILNPGSMTRLALVDTLLLENGWGLSAVVQVASFYTFAGNDDDEVNRLIHLALKQEDHPLTDLFIPGDKAAQEKIVEISQINVPGMVKIAGGEKIIIGGAKFLQSNKINITSGALKARRMITLGETPLFVARNGRLAALVGIRYRLTQNTSHVLEKLSIKGIKIVVLTEESDIYLPFSRETGLAVMSFQEGEKLLTSPGKAGKITALAGEGQKPELLSRADLVIATSGSVIRNSDIMLTRPDLNTLEQLFTIGFDALQKERQNIGLTAVFNAFGLLLGASGRLAPVPASLFNNLISMLVLLNSYRLLFFSAGKLQNNCAPKNPVHPSGRSNKQVAKDDPAQNPKTALMLPDKGSKNYRQLYTVNKASNAEQSLLPAGLFNWHSLESGEVLRILKTMEKEGLAQEEAEERLALYGPNQLPAVDPSGFMARLLNQFKNFLVQSLLGSSFICFFLGEFADSLAILTILVFNALIGAMQEQRAESALHALKKITVPLARVKRDGQWQRIPSFLLVPGDIILLETGDGVPADARVLKAISFQVNESTLTGEAYPVNKDNSTVPDCVTLIDCRNMVFMGTAVSHGWARAVVAATGTQTELGKIAGLLKNDKAGPTALQRNLTAAGRKVLAGSLAASGLLSLAGIIRREPPFAMFLTGISLAVAAIPEGLPAIVTMTMAAGVHRMAREKAVVRTLPAVENIGGVTVICTDKTGTLTRNEQIVQMVACADGGYWQRSEEGDFWPENTPGDRKTLFLVFTAGVLASNAWRERGETTGDPLEKAIFSAAVAGGLDADRLRRDFQRIAENPFDATRRYMSAIYRQHSTCKLFSFVKGAPEVVLELCSSYFNPDGAVPLDEPARRWFSSVNSRMAGSALRVLAVAYRPLDNAAENPSPAENNLTLLGLMGIYDPPRHEVREAVKKCRNAGVKVVMISGDHCNTALAVGRELGLVQAGSKVLTGTEMENLSDEQLAAAVRDVHIFARVLPAHKLRLVKAFQQQGERVAMIGDGVNDAPAVKQADIGIAMGISGTDVTKEAADIILADDNFATVVAAVEQGRGIYDNVQRSVLYLLATNMGEILLVLFSVFAGLPLPLLPIQLLWLNLLGDSFPALGLSLDPPDRALMDRPPRDPGSSFFDRDYMSMIKTRGLSISATALGAYWWGLKNRGLEQARTIALSSLTASQLLYALDCRQNQSEEKAGRRLTVGATALSGGLLLAALYLPSAARIFKTVPLRPGDWLPVILSAWMSNALDKFMRMIKTSSSPSSNTTEDDI